MKDITIEELAKSLSVVVKGCNYKILSPNKEILLESDLYPDDWDELELKGVTVNGVPFVDLNVNINEEENRWDFVVYALEHIRRIYPPCPEGDYTTTNNYAQIKNVKFIKEKTYEQN